MGTGRVSVSSSSNKTFSEYKSFTSDEECRDHEVEASLGERRGQVDQDRWTSREGDRRTLTKVDDRHFSEHEWFVRPFTRLDHSEHASLTEIC